MREIIIKEGLIIDGTGAEGYPGDVAIKDGIITTVGQIKTPPHAKIIDANGLAVAPGFIDMHSHADFSLPLLPTADSLIHQGITTAVTGQCGLSPAPLYEPYRQELISSFDIFKELDGEMPWDEWDSFGEYLAYLERLGIAINVLPLVGHGNIRANAMGFGAEKPSQKQMQRMQSELLRALNEGAVGVSTGLIYPPGTYTSTEELIELLCAAEKHNVFYFTHIRGGAASLLEAIHEAIQIGEATGTRVQISHFKAVGRKNWDKSATALDIVECAAAKGLDVGTDIYPYTAASTELAVLLPAWARDGGKEATLRYLSDPVARAKMTQTMKTSGLAASIEWDTVLINGSQRQPDYQGRFVSELSEKSGKTPYKWIFDALLESELQITMIAFVMSEDNIRQAIRHPLMTFGTDGMGLSTKGSGTLSMPHPRNFGTFARILDKYVRNDGVLTLAEAVHKMTGHAAKRLGLNNRGFITPGCVADLVVFDPVKVVDTATYEHPHQKPEGFYDVLVSGSPVLENGIHTQACPGKVLPDKAA